MTFGLPDGLQIKVPKGYTCFTISGKAFCCDYNEYSSSLLIAMVDKAGNHSWKTADHSNITNAVLEHLKTQERANSDSHM